MRKAGFLLATVGLFASCANMGHKGDGRAKAPAVEYVAPSDWPEMEDGLDAASFVRAGEQSLSYLRKKGNAYYRLGTLQVGSQRLIDTIEELGQILEREPSKSELGRVLQERFQLYRLNRSTGALSAHYSSYYQPILEASRKQTTDYPYPIYKKPKDMLEVDLGLFGKKWEGQTLVGRVDESGNFVPYFDRRGIDIRKSLSGKGLEVAWLKTEFDRLNLHIQGSGLLRFPDGSEAIARFAATNSLPYKSVGMTVVGSGAMSRSEITSEKLRQYLKDHPEGEAWLISQNPRYTFFTVDALEKDAEPSGSIGLPLTAGRSIAIDPKFVPLGAVAFVSLPMIQADEKGGWLGKYPVRRFAHCQDTGGAIKGPGRIDLYMGHGPQAKATAHNVWEKGNLYILLLKLPERDR